MEQLLINITENQGIWAVLFVFMLLYTIKKNDKLSEKQEQREYNYQKMLFELTERFSILEDVNQKLDGLIRSKKEKEGAS